MSEKDHPPVIDISQRRQEKQKTEQAQREELTKKESIQALQRDVQSELIRCRLNLGEVLGPKISAKVDRSISGNNIILGDLNNNPSGIPPEIFPEDSCAFLDEEKLFVFNSNPRALDERIRFLNHNFNFETSSKLSQVALTWQVSDLYGAIVAANVSTRSKWEHGGTEHMLGFVAANGGDTDRVDISETDTQQMTLLFANEQLPIRLQAGVSRISMESALSEWAIGFDSHDLWKPIARRARKQKDLVALAYALPMSEDEVISITS